MNGTDDDDDDDDDNNKNNLFLIECYLQWQINSALQLMSLRILKEWVYYQGEYYKKFSIPNASD